MAVTTETFGTLKDGREAHLFTISTSAGSSVTLTDFGAAVVKTIVPDGMGRLGDVRKCDARRGSKIPNGAQ